MRRNGACFSIAFTTAQAIITEGDAAFLPSFFFAAWLALRIANFYLPLAHPAGKGRFNWINGLVGFNFTERIVERDCLTRFLQKRNDFGVANSFPHDRDRNLLRISFLVHFCLTNWSRRR